MIGKILRNFPLNVDPYTGNVYLNPATGMPYRVGYCPPWARAARAEFDEDRAEDPSDDYAPPPPFYDVEQTYTAPKNSSQITAEVVAEIIATVLNGNTQITAHKRAGITTRIFKAWMEQGRTRLKKMEANPGKEVPNLYSTLVIGVRAAEAEFHADIVEDIRVNGTLEQKIAFMKLRFSRDYHGKDQTKPLPEKVDAHKLLTEKFGLLQVVK